MKTNQKTKTTVVSVLIFFLSLIFISATAEVKLPTILSSNMVIQRDIPVNIWGWAKPGEKVSVLFNGQNLNTVALADGTWKVTLKPMKAGGAFDMDIKGQNTITLKNILFQLPVFCLAKIFNQKLEYLWDLSKVRWEAPELRTGQIFKPCTIF
jgi:sialate O-acetylesterase